MTSVAAPDPVTGAPLATIRERVLARAIDTALLLACAFLVIGGATASGNQQALDAAVIAVVVGPFAYEWLLLGACGQTLGRMRMGIAVRRAQDATPFSYPRALARILAYQLLAMFLVPLLAGVLWGLRDARRQTWHDKAARTVVVRIAR